jgi:cyclopropane-fatty-acyl-phospholipid synthase
MSSFSPLTTDIDIPAWGSKEARRKEEHVSRFLEREYKASKERAWSLEELGVSTTSGPMWEETEELIEGHYDERIEFFESFLDEEYHAYSMAYYGETPEDILNNDVTLEQAQANKFGLICERAEIKGNENILNIGCGFGSFEKYLLKRYPDVRVTGITPSNVQVGYLKKKIQARDSLLGQGNFSVIKKDFSSISDEDLEPGSFDLVISIGLLEQVKNMDALNEKISRLLRKGGRSFHHFIVSKMVIPQFLDAEQTLIGGYFPGGRIWPYDEFTFHGRGLDFQQSWFINGMNYWKTLDEWHRRYWSRMSLLSKHLTAERLSHWNDYFILCKACFLPENGELFGNAHYLFRKP